MKPISYTTFSILSIAAEFPYIIQDFVSFLFNKSDSARGAFNSLCKRGYLEIIKSHKVASPKTHYAITALGLEHLQNEEHKHKFICNGLSDNPSSLYLRTPSIPMNIGAFQTPGNSHFKNDELMRFCMQLRFSKIRRRTILGDHIDYENMEGLFGRPDIIHFDGHNSIRNQFERLVIFEYETTAKSAAKIKSKIESLLANQAEYIIFVARDFSVLRQISVALRNNIRSSTFHNGKSNFCSEFYLRDMHTKRIFFMEWDVHANPINSYSMRNVILKRADHPDFHHYKIGENAFGHKYRKLVMKDTWNGYGPNEIKLNDLLLQREMNTTKIFGNDFEKESQSLLVGDLNVLRPVSTELSNRFKFEADFLRLYQKCLINFHISIFAKFETILNV